MVAEFTPRFAASPNLPPQNIDAEESLLGAILLDPEAIGRVVNRLCPEAFYLDSHSLIYRAVLEVHKQGEPVDLMTVTAWLYDHKKLEKVGGQCRLAELVSQCVTSVNADRYADLILDKFIRRQLIQAGNDIIQFGYEAFRKLPEIFSEAKERLSALADTPLLSGEDPAQLAYNKLCLEVQQIELNISDPGLRLWRLQELAQQYKRSVKQLEAIYFMSLLKEENESLLSWKELCDRYGDQVREWLLHGFLPKGVTVAVHARGGVGKTRLVYDMVHTLVTGSSWNGFPTTGSRRTIVIQTDESAGDMLDALRRRGFDENLDNIRYKTRWTFEHIPQLRAEIEEFKPEVIVIDSITSVSRHSLFSENDVQYARPILKLKDLAQQYGCTIVLVHHSSKNGDARGTTAIFNSVSEVWKLEKDPDDKTPGSTKRLLTIEKSRSRRPTTYKLDFDPENGSWGLLSEVGVDENNPDLSTKDRIIEFLLRNTNIRYEAQEVAHEIDGAAPRVRILLAQMANDGIISLIRPIKGKSKANLYFIAHETSDRLPDRPPDQLSDRPQEIRTCDRPPDQLNNAGMARLSDTCDRAITKNASAENKNDPKLSDRAITCGDECPEPSNINKNNVIALTDRVTDRPRGGDHISWTKAVFAAVSQPAPENPANERPGAEVERWKVGDQVRILKVKEKSDRHLVGCIGTIYQLAMTGLRIRIGDSRITCPPSDVNKLIAPDQVVESELSDEDLEDMAASGFDHMPGVAAEESEQTAVTVTVQNRPRPYHHRTNPPKQGDRIRSGYGKAGQITLTRKSNPRYEITWEDGQIMGYEFEDLQVLDIRREE